LGWNPKVAHFMGFFPYVKIQKPKTQWEALQSKWHLSLFTSFGGRYMVLAG
jgi:hypothetical protein